MWLVRLLLCAAFVADSLGTDAAGDRLYFTNGTCIWSLALPSEAATADAPDALTCAARRAVGLAVEADFVFWSDVDESAAGVYRASIADAADARRIVSDVGTVNGLAVDRVARLLYWTDERAQLIEVAAYDGSMRVVIVSNDLGKPRGLLVDPLAGYLYWNDQERGTLERCRLDGSERRVLLKRYTLLWPNQMAFGDDNLIDSRLLFFADGFTGRVHSYDGRTGETVRALPSRLSPENVTLFGLAVDRPRLKLYASDWAGSIHELGAARLREPLAAGALSLDGAARRTLVVGYSTIFSLALFTAASDSSPTVDTACTVDNGGCSHLCLRTGAASSASHRCACPSYAGLALDADGRRCREPHEVLVYASAGNGYIAFRDLKGWNGTDGGGGDGGGSGGSGDELYVVARSSRPVAVTYDPVKKMVFWSDVEERFIATARLNGSERRHLLPAASIGIVDGLAYDYATENLYFTNIGEIQGDSDNQSFSWHTVEVISTRTMARRVIINSLQKPRALAIDHETRYLYVSDWGSNPKVIRCRMDGSVLDTIKPGRWSNPNALALHDSMLYVLDARLSTGAPTLTRIQIRSKSHDDLEQPLPGGIPFGLAISDGFVHVSDMNSSSVYKFYLGAFGTAKVEAFVRDVAEPMAMAYEPLLEYAVSATPEQGQGCHGYDICIKDERHELTGYCTNVGTAAISKSKRGCSEPDRFALVADLSSVRIVDLGTTESGILVSRDPFASNIVGVAYDRKSQTVYYSDADEGNVYAVNFGNTSEQRLVYDDNGSVDALIFDDATSTLYWSVAASSQSASYISSLRVATGAPTTPTTAVRNIDAPRGLFIADGTLYWTERGRNPRVQYKSLDGNLAAKTLSRRWPEGRAGLHSPNSIASSADSTHIGDFDVIVTCGRRGAEQECRSRAVDHVFGLAAAVGEPILYYTDWNNSMLASIDESGSVRRVLTGCVRPSMLVIGEHAGSHGKSEQQADSAPPTWIILAIAVGSVVLIVTILALIVLYCRRRRNAQPGAEFSIAILGGGGGGGGEVGLDNNQFAMTEKPSAKYSCEAASNEYDLPMTSKDH